MKGTGLLGGSRVDVLSLVFLCTECNGRVESGFTVYKRVTGLETGAAKVSDSSVREETGEV